MNSQTLKFKDATIYVRRFGKGKPLILLPGWPISSAFIQILKPYLSEKIEVVSIDFPGWSGNSTGNIQASIESYADLTKKCIDKLYRGKKISIGGVSIGGTIALLVAARAPDKINKVIIQGSPYEGKSFNKRFPIQVFFMKKAQSRKWLASILKLVYTLQKLAIKNLMKNPELTPIKDEILGDMNNLDNKAALDFALKFFNTDYGSIFKKISAETIVICGENDNMATPEIAGTLVNDILPNGKYIFVPKGTHYLLAENPKLFSEIIENHIL